MPPMVFPNVVSQFFPPTSQTTRGSYVRVLHNISHPLPPTIGPSGHTSLGPIGPALHPPTSYWVHHRHTNIGNQYLSKEQYNNPLYVPYPGGVTNQLAQPTYGPQTRFNQVLPPFMGQNDPNYQKFGGFYDQPQYIFGLTIVVLPY